MAHSTEISRDSVLERYLVNQERKEESAEEIQLLEDYERKTYLQIMKEQYGDRGPLHEIILIGKIRDTVNPPDVGQSVTENVVDKVNACGKNQNVPELTGVLIVYNTICVSVLEGTIDQINHILGIHAMETANNEGVLQEVKVLSVTHDPDGALTYNHIPERLCHRWLWKAIKALKKDRGEDVPTSIHKISRDLYNNLLRIIVYLRATGFTMAQFDGFFELPTELSFKEDEICKLFQEGNLLTAKEHYIKYIGPQFILLDEDVLLPAPHLSKMFNSLLPICEDDLERASFN